MKSFSAIQPHAGAIQKGVGHTPPVTVIMPVYNAECFVAEALASVLRQSYGEFEFLVVDDGSRDGTAQIVESMGDPRIRCLRNDDNMGIAASLNRGLKAAGGELIARADADDVWLPDFLGQAVDMLNRHPDVGLVGAPDLLITHDGRRIPNAVYRARTVEGLRLQMLFRNPFLHSAVVYRRQIALEVAGGYDVAMEGLEDFDLWERMLKHCQPAMLDRPGVFVRERADSIRGKAIKARNHQGDPRYERGVKIIRRWADEMLEACPDLIEPVVRASAHLQFHRDLPRGQEVLKPFRQLYRVLVRRLDLPPGVRTDMDRVMACFLSHATLRLAVRQRRIGEAVLAAGWAFQLKTWFAGRTFARLFMAEVKRRLTRRSRLLPGT